MTSFSRKRESQTNSGHFVVRYSRKGPLNYSPRDPSGLQGSKYLRGKKRKPKIVL